MLEMIQSGGVGLVVCVVSWLLQRLRSCSQTSALLSYNYSLQHPLALSCIYACPSAVYACVLYTWVCSVRAITGAGRLILWHGRAVLFRHVVCDTVLCGVAVLGTMPLPSCV